MTTLYLYRDDYADSPRETEWSEKVVRLWYDERVRYADEDITDSQCLGIVAERLIVRRLLGLDTLDMTYLPKAAHAKPFGYESPILAELLMPGVFIAMAFIPLSPLGQQGRPIMARLYCVSGLANRYRIALDGNEETALQGFSWFLAGVPQVLMNNGVVGRSWLLAANLLSRIVEKQDVKTARNLAKHYIVTGDVSNGVIRRVEILRKPELVKQFDNFKWIIPKENDMDMPKRKIEKPETLEDAYQLIESMRSKATRSLFRFLRECNLAGVKDQYDIGADIFAREEKTDLTCLEVVASMKAQLYAAEAEDKKSDVKVDIEAFKNSLRRSFAALDEIDQWLRLQGADSSMMFYLMAVNRDEAGIVKCCEYTNINSCNKNGNTAVDLALIGGNFEAAKLLHQHGGRPNPRLGANRKLANAIRVFCDPDSCSSANQNRVIVHAIDLGFPPETSVEVPPTREEEASCPLWNNTSLYAVAVDYANYEILEACLRNGVDANKKLFWTRLDIDYYGEEHDYMVKAGTPWEVLSRRFDMKGEKRQGFRELLLRYGADIPEE
jgi:hypothetical protein